jgi:hypothetical protein
MIIIVMSYLYTTRNLVICQGFLTGAHTPGKVETRAFDIFMICRGITPGKRVGGKKI